MEGPEGAILIVLAPIGTTSDDVYENTSTR